MTCAVLGLGNPLLADDGAGLAVLERLRDAGTWSSDVSLVDGGTWGLSLVPVIAEHARLLVLDAVRAGHEPGAVLRGSGDAVPRMYRRPLSPHQIDLAEVLAAAELVGAVPEELEVVGIEPDRTDGPCVTLTAPVAAAVPRAVDEALRVLDRWGYRPR